MSESNRIQITTYLELLDQLGHVRRTVGERLVDGSETIFPALVATQLAAIGTSLQTLEGVLELARQTDGNDAAKALAQWGAAFLLVELGRWKKLGFGEGGAA